MKLSVIYNKYIPNYKNSLDIVIKSIKSKGIEHKVFELESLEKYGDLALVIGGDGTILRAARFYSRFDIPSIGINIGRLGFLAQAGLEDIEKVLTLITKGEYITEERLMLASDEYTALNDFVIKGCVPTRTSKFFLEINEKFICDYIADGLIISTPTGSTAYCLSAGGPILHPELDAIVIVPICPHTLNVRPLVVPSGELITVKTNDELLSVSIDGYNITQCAEKTTIKISPQKAKLAFLENGNFYSVLRNKLHWGVSPESKHI